MMIVATVIAACIATLIGAGTLTFSVRAVLDGDILSEMSGFGLAILIGVISSVNLGYFIASERLLDGQSAGKRIIGLRVVREGGYALSWPDTIVRNVARVVDMLPGVYLVALLSVLLSRRGKRLGDFMAGTIVVRHRKVPPPTDHFDGARYSNTQGKVFGFRHEHIVTLGPSGFALLDGYFDRIDGMSAERKAELERTIAQTLAEQLNIEVTEKNRAAFLKELYLAVREDAESR